MISLAEAQARLIALASPLPQEVVPLPDAIGRWAAATISAKRTQPPRDTSAMDGYAIAHASLPGPWRVIGESAAGKSFAGSVVAGEAVRIFTGASLPAGSDTIIIQEDVTHDGDQIVIPPDLSIRAAQHVRPAGGDFISGTPLIEAGDRLTPARIALAAAGGHGSLPVRRRPRIDILSTGNELVPAGAPVGEDQIPESNAIMIGALLQDMRCTVHSPGIVRDEMESMTAAISASDADILVTCGGASVGDHDLVRPALAACGAHLDFWQVAMRPGKPVMAGKRGNQIILGLPGNPASAFVTAFLFLRPLIASLSGAADPLPTGMMAILDAPLPEAGNRTDHVRALELGGRVAPVGQNDSSALRGLAAANALIFRPAGAPAARAGEQVEILRIA